MKKFLPTSNTLSVNKAKGFTLIELLIVITIIAVLATIGFVVYSGLNTGPRSRNVTRRADLDSISKAFEVNFDKATNPAKYAQLAVGQFVNGAIPVLDQQNKQYCGAIVSTAADPSVPATGWTNCTDITVPATTYTVVSATNPVPAGGSTSWKICTWLEDEDGAGAGTSKAFCKINAQ